jgi:hypothetical protein
VAYILEVGAATFYPRNLQDEGDAANRRVTDDARQSLFTQLTLS